MNDENDPTLNHGDGWSGAIDGDLDHDAFDGKIFEEVSDSSKVEVIKDLPPEMMMGKKKGLRHQPAMNAVKKRKSKIALQKASRKRNRSK